MLSQQSISQKRFWQNAETRSSPPLHQTTLSVISLAISPTSLALAGLQVGRTLSVPLCFFLALYLFLSHAFFAVATWCCFTIFCIFKIKVYPYSFRESNMGFSSLLYYTLLGWAYWPLGFSSFFFCLILLGNLTLSYSFTFSAFQDPFYSSRRVILLWLPHIHCPSRKKSLWAQFGPYFLLFNGYSSSWAIA